MLETYYLNFIARQIYAQKCLKYRQIKYWPPLQTVEQTNETDKWSSLKQDLNWIEHGRRSEQRHSRQRVAGLRRCLPCTRLAKRLGGGRIANGRERRRRPPVTLLLKTGLSELLRLCIHLTLHQVFRVFDVPEHILQRPQWNPATLLN